MAFGGFSQEGSAPMAEINVIPLVDIMLVLLVIFIITAPVLTHAVKVDLPQAEGQPAPDEFDAVTLTIDADGALHWNDQPLPNELLDQWLRREVAGNAQFTLHLRADRAVPYDRVAQVLATSRNVGVSRIGFVMEPGGPAESSE